MKLTVLDGHGLNPGDLSWDCVKSLVDDFSVYDRSPQELVAERIDDSQLVLLNKVNITKDIVSKCKNLKYIGVLATGYNVVDTKACREAGITVTNIPSYSTEAVAQHVFSFILNFSNQVEKHNQSVQNGGWIKSPDFCYWLTPLFELAGKTLGIFGFGHIGQKVAQIAHAFGMNVQICVHNEKSFTGNEKSVSFEELLKTSDFVTLHAPMTSQTEKIINKESLSLMKKSAYLINTARGGLVDEAVVRDALENGSISGYAADVILNEPMKADCPLYKAKNCVITPHLAWVPFETRKRLLGIEVDNIKSFLNGNPINVVN